MCVGVSVWLGWSGIRVDVASWSTASTCNIIITIIIIIMKSSHPSIENQGSSASACNTDTTPTQPHRNSNTHGTKNNTTKVEIQQNSRKLLVMDILMSEKCWALKKWNKIASDINLVFYSSIFLSICLSKTRRLFSSFSVNVQVSDEYVMTGLIIVLYILILVQFCNISH